MIYRLVKIEEMVYWAVIGPAHDSVPNPNPLPTRCS